MLCYIERLACTGRSIVNSTWLCLLWTSSQVSKENICDKLAVADGSFMGTTFKVEGKLENLTDYYRVKDFMDIVKEFRREYFYNY